MAEAAGLGLAVVPIIISALENYEHTFQAIIIFSHRYKREAERFQNVLKVHEVDFRNECVLLLSIVSSDIGLVLIEDRHRELVGNKGLESQLRDRLSDSYGGCIAALTLVNDLLEDILKETNGMEILRQKARGILTRDSLKHWRQRSKIGFSKDRFDAKLLELGRRVEGLRRIRKQIIDMESKVDTERHGEDSLYPISDARRIRQASLKLHDILSSTWQCGISTEHYADLSLEAENFHEEANEPSGNMNFQTSSTSTVEFHLAWSCLTHSYTHSDVSEPVFLAVKAVLECHETCGKRIASKPKQDLQQKLHNLTQSSSQRQDREALVPDQRSTSTAVDLTTVPNLCRHLTQVAAPAETCMGFLQRHSPTFKHYLYISQSPVDLSDTISLATALDLARQTADGLPLPGKLKLAKLLAMAVLQLYSTPWLTKEWKSTDVMLFGFGDFMRNSITRPYFRSAMKTQHPRQSLTVARGNGKHQLVRNQILFSLGVLLVEIAYDSPLQYLQEATDDQGDTYTASWTARRLGDDVWRKLGPKYCEAVKTCLWDGCGVGSGDLQDTKVQTLFVEEVVQKLEGLAKAVDI